MKNKSNFPLSIRSVLLFLFFIQVFSATAQYEPEEITEPINLNGPRFGVTYISEGELADQLKTDYDVNPIITQFGWQFETRFFTQPSGTAGLVEGVLLLGGLEQNVILPSATLLVGLRSPKGLEVGFGPNVSLAGASYAFAAGVTFRSHNINFPVNFAVATSSKGMRYSLMIGFNARRR